MSRIGYFFGKIDILVVFDTEDFRSITADEMYESGESPSNFGKANGVAREQGI